MRKLVFLTVVLSWISGASVQAQVASAQWQLVWQDEFDLDGVPDSNHWCFEKGFVRNQELQWYQPDNAYCNQGKLIIEARKAAKLNPWYEAGSRDWRKRREEINYTSSSLLTRGLHSWQYGRFEMRAKIDGSDGMWPAFWTLGIRGPWPACGEIDIMEYYRGAILANVAWARKEPYTAYWDTVKKPLDSLGEDWVHDFHVWRMDWDDKYIRLYVDDWLLNETSLERTINEYSEVINPMRQPHYMIINLAIGGDNGGDPSHAEFPLQYVIDYVRVYQHKKMLD